METPSLVWKDNGKEYANNIRNRGLKWEFNNNITTKICRYAGRDASSALSIALGKRHAAVIARTATYHTPFSYSDWSSNRPINPRHPKKPVARPQFRRPGTKASTVADQHISEARWKSFQHPIERSPMLGKGVKHIALAPWMGVEDLLWVVKFCPALTDLDLSHCSTLKVTEEHVDPRDDTLNKFLRKLTWLGLKDWRGNEQGPRDNVEAFLPQCRNLNTFCIRGEYKTKGEQSAYDNDFEDLIQGIGAYAPNTLTAIELRLPLPLTKRFLTQLFKAKPSLKHVGVDIDAWAQMYSKIIISQVDPPNRISPGETTVDSQQVKYLSNCMYEVSHNIQTMGKMPSFADSIKSWHGEIGLMSSSFGFYTLQSEYHTYGSDAVHPLILLKQTGEDSEADPSEIYQWLASTFKWTPVFDWTTLMRFKFPLIKRPNFFPTIQEHMAALRNCGVPIHLLIRSPSHSQTTLLWGSECGVIGWDAILKEELEANLDLIAPLVDTLSILYDNRSPVQAQRLKSMHAIEPIPLSRKRKAVTLSPADAPPVRKRPNAGLRKPVRGPDASNPNRYISRLASNTRFNVTAGEHADEYNSDDSEWDENAKDVPMHHLARRSSYLREALVWHRFWNKYHSSFTALTELHVRMPFAFDKIKSIKLGKLMAKTKGWTSTTYAFEREAVWRGTDEEGTDAMHDFDRAGGGKFVRRSWYLNEAPKVDPLEPKSKQQQDPNDVAPERLEILHDQEVDLAMRLTSLASGRERTRRSLLEGRQSMVAVDRAEEKRVEVVDHDELYADPANVVSPPAGEQDLDIDDPLNPVFQSMLAELEDDSSPAAPSFPPAAPATGPKKATELTADEQRLLDSMKGAGAADASSDSASDREDENDEDEDDDDEDVAGTSFLPPAQEQDDEDAESVEDEVAEAAADDVAQEAVDALIIEEVVRQVRTEAAAARTQTGTQATEFRFVSEEPGDEEYDSLFDGDDEEEDEMDVDGDVEDFDLKGYTSLFGGGEEEEVESESVPAPAVEDEDENEDEEEVVSAPASPAAPVIDETGEGYTSLFEGEDKFLAPSSPPAPAPIVDDPGSDSELSDVPSDIDMDEKTAPAPAPAPARTIFSSDSDSELSDAPSDLSSFSVASRKRKRVEVEEIDEVEEVKVVKKRTTTKAMVTRKKVVSVPAVAPAPAPARRAPRRPAAAAAAAPPSAPTRRSARIAGAAISFVALS